jgi:hypothetical protein
MFLPCKGICLDFSQSVIMFLFLHVVGNLSNSAEGWLQLPRDKLEWTLDMSEVTPETPHSSSIRYIRSLSVLNSDTHRQILFTFIVNRFLSRTNCTVLLSKESILVIRVCLGVVRALLRVPF